MNKITTVPELANAYQRIEVEIPNFVYNGASIPDTEVDVATITLTPGTWVLGYDVTVFLRNFSGGSLAISARTQYTDNSNLAIAKTRAWYNTAPLNNNEFQYQNASRQTEVVLTETTTFKLRLVTTVDGSVNEVAVAGANVTGAITGPDNNSTLWAERKRL
jgi:hypothetical protein